LARFPFFFRQFNDFFFLSSFFVGEAWFACCLPYFVFTLLCATMGVFGWDSLFPFLSHLLKGDFFLAVFPSCFFPFFPFFFFGAPFRRIKSASLLAFLTPPSPPGFAGAADLGSFFFASARSVIFPFLFFTFGQVVSPLEHFRLRFFFLSSSDRVRFRLSGSLARCFRFPCLQLRPTPQLRVPEQLPFRSFSFCSFGPGKPLMNCPPPFYFSKTWPCRMEFLLFFLWYFSGRNGLLFESFFSGWPPLIFSPGR